MWHDDRDTRDYSRGGGGGGRSRGGDYSRGSVGSTRVFVGNLSFRTEWTDLKDHCRKAGLVLHAKIIQGSECAL